MQTPSSHYITANALNLHYLEAGEGDPILLVHDVDARNLAATNQRAARDQQALRLANDKSNLDEHARVQVKLPGGQETARMQKLYLSFRERAIVETRKELERLTSGRYDRAMGKATVMTRNDYIGIDVEREGIGRFVAEALFLTITNVNFDPEIACLSTYYRPSRQLFVYQSTGYSGPTPGLQVEGAHQEHGHLIASNNCIRAVVAVATTGGNAFCC